MSEQSERIENLFTKAWQENVDLTLTFLLDKCQFSVIHAPCVMVKRGYFVVRAPLASIKKEKIIWGAEVDGFFSVRLEDVENVHFKSRLVRLYNAPPDSMFLTFPLPESIGHGQRRNSKRVDLDRDTSEGFGIWYGSMEGGDLEHIPQQIWRPFENEQAELAEFSASGLRIDLKDDNPLLGKLGIDDPILLKGDFGLKGKPQPIFVLGAIARKMPRRDKEGWMSLGCHFRSWRKILGPEGERWFKADPTDGIALINQWLIRYSVRAPSRAHLEEMKLQQFAKAQSR